MAHYRPRRRTTRARTNGVRRTGALIINGRRRRRTRTARKTRSNGYLVVRRNGTRKRRNGKRRARTSRVMYLRARKNGRRRTTRRRTTRRRTARSTGRRRTTQRRTRRNGRLVIRHNGRRSRRNGRRSRRRSNGASGSFSFKLPFTDSLARMVGKVPVVGGFAAKAIALSGAAALGAASVLPTTFVAQFAGQYVPNMNSSLFYAIVGLGLASVIGSTKFLGASFHRNLAVATAAAGGAVALYKWQTGDDGPMAVETGRLMVRGPVAGLGTLLIGRRNVGGYGPMAVRPMATSHYPGM